MPKLEPEVRLRRVPLCPNVAQCALPIGHEGRCVITHPFLLLLAWHLRRCVAALQTEVNQDPDTDHPVIRDHAQRVAAARKVLRLLDEHRIGDDGRAPT